MKLSIVIPTFDRNSILASNIKFLLPQLRQDVQLTVLDNASPVHVETTFRDCGISNPFLRVIRNRVNVGGNANILRSFEISEAEWTWVLGDDDHVRPDAVDRILEATAECSAATYINFSCNNPPRASQTLASGLTEFIDKMDAFSNVLFISSSVYRQASILPNVRYGYHHLQSMAPHVALLLCALLGNEQAIFRPDSIVDYDGTEPAKGFSPAWQYNAMFLVELAPRHDLQVKLARRIAESLPSPLYVARQLLNLQATRRDAVHYKYLFDRAMGHRFYFDHKFVEVIKGAVAELSMMFPDAARTVLRHIGLPDGDASSMTDRL